MCKKKNKKTFFYLTGLLVGIANGLFGSGGGVISVPMLEKGGVDAQKSHASSIALTLVLSVVSSIVYITGGSADISEALKYVPMGLAGAIIGAKLLKNLSSDKLHKLFGIVMIAAGIRLLLRKG